MPATPAMWPALDLHPLQAHQDLMTLKVVKLCLDENVA